MTFHSEKYMAPKMSQDGKKCVSKAADNQKLKQDAPSTSAEISPKKKNSEVA